MNRSRSGAFWFLIAFCAAHPLLAASNVITVGSGSYTTDLPPAAKGPTAPLFIPQSAQGKVPTSDWWSSLVWSSNSFPLFAHPLAFQSHPRGLRVAYPGSHITAGKSAIFGSMPSGGNDLVIGHSQAARFAHPQVASFSDWFVTLRFETNQQSLTLSFGHGSPFVYGTITGGDPAIEFPAPPEIWFNTGGTLGIECKGNLYGLFGPSESSWNGLDTVNLTCRTGGKGYFSIALLPKKDEATLNLFRRFAHAHVTDTRIDWSYEAASSTVDTRFHVAITNYEGNATGTVLALYPHQWRNTDTSLLPLSYQSVRGRMQLVNGSSFTTKMRFPGVLPSLPKIGTSGSIPALVDEEIKPWRAGFGDTYWEGKRLGRLANLVPIAEQYALSEPQQRSLKQLRERLEQWFTAADTNGTLKRSGLFYHDARWGTMIGFPAGYGSNTELNDHHLHYGYFLRAAAEIARNDPGWAKHWGGMVELLIRDIASPDRSDRLFPFLRCFDPYAGHSWASGHAKFGDGNNQESSSEAMNAWYGIILWGAATRNPALRDLGIYLYTTEMNAIQEYWFNVHGDNFPASYPASVVTMVWGGKGANGTWFTADPQLVHAINWLPIHAGSIYLGLYPDYVDKNYRALVNEFGSDHWNNWPDLIWMYRALSNPADAVRMLEAAGTKYRSEDGNSRANTAHWIYTLNALGQVDRTVTANTPCFAVFRKGDRRTYITYTFASESVTFSDGTKLDSKTGFTIHSP